MGFNQMSNQMRMPTVVNGPMGVPQLQRPPTQPKYRAQTAAAAAAGASAQTINVPGQEPLTTGMLAAAQPQEQKQMLGERLYPLIHTMHPEWAGKITGMLLEIDNAELLHMLDSRESLKAKVGERSGTSRQHLACFFYYESYKGLVVK